MEKKLVFLKEDKMPKNYIFEKNELNKIKWNINDVSFTKNKIINEDDIIALLAKEEDAKNKNDSIIIDEIKLKKKAVWIESQTIKYNGASLAEFQIHRHRKSYKFRFNMFNLRKLL